LFKRRSFIIIITYPIVIYIVLDNNTPRIAIFTNPIKKRLEFNKNIQLKIIYKCIDIIYIMIDIIKTFVTMTTTSFILLDLFFTIQKKTIFSNRYQNINLIIQLFEKGIELSTFGTEFTFTPEIEAIFTVKSSIYSLSFKIDFLINVVS